MPWDAHSFQALHNHHLGIAQAGHAASVANAILRRSGNDGLAIATANARERHRDDGGGIDSSQGIGGPTPTMQTQNPLVQGFVQRYATMPIEKLTEYAQLLGNSPQGQIVRQMLAKRRTMPNAQPASSAQPQTQPQVAPTASSAPLATDTSVAQRRGGATPHRDGGGPLGVSMSMASPWWTKREASQNTRGSGFLAGATPGRADALHTTAAAGSYVVPADVVAGLGEGNSMAGARVMDEMLRTGPGGVPMPQGRGRSTMPRPPPAPGPRTFEARGGQVGNTPVALSHGEYVISPDDVLRIGGGDLKRGHRVLDAFVVHERRKHIAKLNRLPGPVKESA